MLVSSKAAAFLPAVVTDREMLCEIGRLRVRAWLADGELPSIITDPDIWLDDHDDHGTNWAILHEGKPIAAARLCVHDRAEDLPDLVSLVGYESRLVAPIGAFTRLVVDPGFRGLGLSRLLDQTRRDAAIRQRCKCICGVSHKPSRVTQLEENGFNNIGISQHRTVRYAPSFVFLRRIRGIGTLDPLAVKPVEIRRLVTAAEIAASQRLRYEVWQNEGVCIKSTGSRQIFDEHDSHAFHWGAFDGGIMVGSARLCLHHDLMSAPDGYMFEGLDLPLPVASINRLVIRQGFRGQGIGNKLDWVRLECAKVLGARAVLAMPVDKTSRKSSLKSHGFVATGRSGAASWSDNVSMTGIFLILDAGDRSDA